jgi:hypothetical protein
MGVRTWERSQKFVSAVSELLRAFATLVRPTGQRSFGRSLRGPRWEAGNRKVTKNLHYTGIYCGWNSCVRYNNVELTSCDALDIRDKQQQRKPSYMFRLYVRHNQILSITGY